MAAASPVAAITSYLWSFHLLLQLLCAPLPVTVSCRRGKLPRRRARRSWMRSLQQPSSSPRSPQVRSAGWRAEAGWMVGCGHGASAVATRGWQWLLWLVASFGNKQGSSPRRRQARRCCSRNFLAGVECGWRGGLAVWITTRYRCGVRIQLLQPRHKQQVCCS
jgi:hypothetical protein